MCAETLQTKGVQRNLSIGSPAKRFVCGSKLCACWQRVVLARNGSADVYDVAAKG